MSFVWINFVIGFDLNGVVGLFDGIVWLVYDVLGDVG